MNRSASCLSSSTSSSGSSASSVSASAPRSTAAPGPGADAGRLADPRLIAFACAAALAVALGVGRFAFTPLLPLMLANGTLDIRHGGWLASANYAGYFFGAVSCAALRVDAARMVRGGLVATIALTAAMGALHGFAVWLPVRFVAGVVSAWTFVFASQWGMRRLTELGAPQWSGAIFTGPGGGIVVTGLIGGALAGRRAEFGWLGFALLSVLLAAWIWRVIAPSAAWGAVARRPAQAGQAVAAGSAGRVGQAQSSGQAGQAGAAGQVGQAGVAGQAGQAGAAGQVGQAAAAGQVGQAGQAGSEGQAAQASHAGQATQAARITHAALPDARHPAVRRDARRLIVLYGAPGFGYIITATFLPVIARGALPPGSPWPDLFWPMFGAALMVGALLASRLPAGWDNRLLLGLSCAVQALGIVLGIAWPTAAGFALGSLLLGLPFTAITLFAMREARRLHGEAAAGLMGYATASYGLGQIAGPLVAAPVAARAGSFTPALWIAVAALLAGALGFAAWAIVARREAAARAGLPDA